MAYIFPNGTIELCKVVPLSPDYRDVVYCGSETQAYNMIQPYITHRYTQESYTRGENGTLKINSIATAIIDCNYLVFQNVMDAGNNKRFFAFITEVRYINNRCSEIAYVIDDFMTWFPGLRLGQCFVEREIPVSDEIGDNLVPENLELGELVEGAVCTHLDFEENMIILEASTLEDGSRPEQSSPQDGYSIEINSYPSALIYMAFHNDETGKASFRRVIKDYTDNGFIENVISVQLIPRWLYVSRGEPFVLKQWSSDKIPKAQSFGAYTPKNNKLFTYPYTRLVVSNLCGQTAEFKYEYFTGGIPSFDAMGTMYATPSIILMPVLYKDHIGYDKDYGLMLTNFVQSPCYNDTYRAYLAQNKASITTGILASVVGGISSMAIGAATGFLPAIVGGGVSIATGVASTVAKVTDAKTMPTTISALSQADALNLVAGQIQFEAKNYVIKEEMARVIDDYFSAYGYACHRVKTPNINARPKWSYVQTKGCIVLGGAPAQAKQNIINAFDNGIRFWTDIKNIGNFSLSNK